MRHGFASPEALGAVRWRAHETASNSDPRDLGIRAILARYGRRAIVWHVVVSKAGEPTPDLQEWANAWEIQAIAAAGGVLRDMEPEEPMRQTFNLTKGGQGNARAWWQGVEAQCTFRWKRFQRALISHVDEFGTANVPGGFVDASGYRLGETVSRVRRLRMIKGRPDEATRRAWLDALPGWIWKDISWTRFQRALIAHVDEFGTANVPYAFVDASGYRLGTTVRSVRQLHMIQGHPDEASRRAWLNALPGWVWTCKDISWKRFQCALIAYVDEFGTSNVPQGFVDASGYRLRATVNSVRQLDHIQGHPDEATRRAWLDALPGWVWSYKDVAWERFMKALLVYIGAKGTARVPLNYIDASGYRLGAAAGRVRQLHMIQGHPDEATRRTWLDALPGWVWNAHDAKWEAFKAAMVRYVRKTGTAYVPGCYIDESGYRLGQTLSNLQNSLDMIKNHPDEAERRAFLDALPGWAWRVTVAGARAHTKADLALLRATTHPDAKYRDVGQIRKAHGIIRAHEVLRDRAIASVLDDVVGAVVSRAL